MKAFTSLMTPAEARKRFKEAFPAQPLGTEWLPLLQASGRVLAEEIRATADLPPFDRATVDGYAVRSRDTGGASRGSPAMLRVAGEVLMGQQLAQELGRGEAVRIPTGGAIPPGADAVVMQEQAVRRDGTVSVEKRVDSGENIVRRGEDLRAGDLVLRPGRRLRPQDVGLLAGLNHAEVEVFIRPKVALIVSGDELVSPGRETTGGQIHDMNTYSLSSLLEQSGALPIPYGIVSDSLQLVAERAKAAHRQADAVILVGGSSVGERDVVTDAIAALGEPGIVVHGIAIRPGKPTILAVASGKPVFGLPGNVVSAMIIYDQFVKPVVESLAGLTEQRHVPAPVRARLAKRLVAKDREDHVRVALVQRGGALWATPVPGGSAIMTSMVLADGILVVPIESTLEEGAEVEVHLLG